LSVYAADQVGGSRELALGAPSFRLPELVDGGEHDHVVRDLVTRATGSCRPAYADFAPNLFCVSGLLAEDRHLVAAGE
jgi:hypothetical protein